MSLDEIRKEYQEFIPENKKINKIEEFLCYLQIGIDDIDESIKDCIREKRLNKKEQIEAQIRNFFFFLFEQEETEYYDEDNAILDESIEFSKSYQQKYYEIREVARVDNYQELYKLVEFSTLYYNKNVSYLNDKARQLELSYQGITFYCQNEDTRKLLLDFLSEEIKKYQHSKIIELKR